MEVRGPPRTNLTRLLLSNQKVHRLTNCVDVARAVNALSFSSEDLLQVIEHYFVLPTSSSVPDSEELSDKEGTCTQDLVKV